MKTFLAAIFLTLCSVNIFAQDPCSSAITIGGCGSSYNERCSAGYGEAVWNGISCNLSLEPIGLEHIYKFNVTITGTYKIQVTNVYNNAEFSYYWQASPCASTGWDCIKEYVTQIGTYGSMQLTKGDNIYLLVKDQVGHSGSQFLPSQTFYISCATVSYPDLTIQYQSANPTTVCAGGQTTVSCYDKNQGTAYADDHVVSYHLSSNTTYGQGDIYLGESNVSGIPVGSYSYPYPSKSLTIPAGTTTGTWYILCSADGGEVITESNENNNTASVQITVSSCSCTSPTASVNSPSGTSSVTMNCTTSGGSGGSISYKWYSGTSCSGTVLGTSSTYTATASGNYACKAYISGYEFTCYTCASGYATIGTSCSSPNSTVNSPTGTGSVTMTCTASGGSGGSILYKWYSGTSCSGTVLGTSSTYTATTSGNYACKAYISGYESICYSRAYGYATIGTTCNLTGITPTLVSIGTASSPGQTISTTTPMLTWNAVTGAINYDVFVSISPYGSSNIIYQQTCVSGTSLTVPSGYLTNGNLYRWNIKANSSCGSSCVSNYAAQLYFTISISSCTTPNATVNSPAGTSSVTMSCTASGGSGGNILYRWYSGTSCSVTPISGATSSTYTATTSGNYACKAYISGYESTCYTCASGYATIGASCSSPVASVNSPSGTGSVTMICAASGGAGGNILYKWYNGSSCSGTVLSTSSAYTATTSGYYSCKAYISGYESTCYSCVSGYATVNSSCTYTLPVTSASYTTSGGSNNTFSVSTQTGCNWTATTGDPSWITLNTASGTGTQAVNYSVASNSGNSRTGYIYVQGNTFTVNQSGACQTPATPTPNFGSISCQGPALYNPTSISLYWSNSGYALNYDVEIREYPYESSNIIFTQNCISGWNVTVNDPDIIPGKMYAWRVRATADCNTCNSAYSALSYFQVAPDISPSGTNYVCDSTGITLSTPIITVPSPGKVSYQWYKMISGVFTPIGSNSDTYYASTSGTYYVKNIYSGSTICAGSAETYPSNYASVSVSTTPNAPTLSSNATVCEGSNLTLSATAPSNSQYFWTGPNGFSSNNNSIYFPSVSVSSTGSYNCYVIKDGCQSPAATSNITINPAPNASFTYKIVNDTVTFTNTSTNASSYNWSFGDGNSSTQTNPSNIYSVNGNYNVCLTTNNTGCNSSSNCQMVSLGGSSSSATQPTFAKLFNDTFSSHKYWWCADIVQSIVDSGYIAIGIYQKSGSNTMQYFKLDKNGNLLWVREFPNTGAQARQIINSQNGYLIIFNYNNISTVMEIDEQGNKLWAKQYSSDFNMIQKVSSGGYVGFSSGQDNKFIIVRIDNSGSILWQKEHSYSLYSSTQIQIDKLIQDSVGNCYLYGWIRDGKANSWMLSLDGIIVKIDSTGNHLWSKYYASSTDVQDMIIGGVVDTNSDILFSGYSRDNTFQVNGFITKINSSGTVLISKQLPQTYASLLVKSVSGNISCLVSGNDNKLLELNSNLSVLQQKDFILKSIYSLKPTLDNNFVVVGQYPYNAANSDYRYNVFKFGYKGSSCLDTVSTSVSPVNFSFTLNSLSSNTSTSSITSSALSISSSTASIKDTSLCHVCNLSASITPSGSTTFCSGDSVMLTANNGMKSYLWSNGQTTKSITVKTSGNYSVAITDSFGCAANSQVVKVTVNSLPYSDAGIDKTICSGDSVSIGSYAVSGNTYSWSPATGLSSTTISNPSASPASTTTYTVTVKNSFGCSSKDTLKIAVNALPTLTITKDTSICSGGSIILTASGGTSYLWNNGEITDVITVTPIATTTYTATVKDTNSCSNNKSVTVTLNTPTANISGTTTICKGSSTTLTASGGSSYSWNTGAIIAAITVTPTTNTTYTATVKDANGCSNSKSVTVTVNSLPATPTITASGSTTFCNGDSVKLTANTGTSYLWSNGASTSAITVKTAGNYTVKVTNANGCSATSTATSVTVNALPAATITTSGSTTFCYGDSVKLTASTGTSYLWSNGATTAAITVKTAGNYTVKVTNANGCSATSAATNVIVNSLPIATITAGSATTFCNGDSVKLTASTGTSYLWSNGASSSAITIKTAGNYTVKVTNANGCSATSAATSVTVNALPAAIITASGNTTFCQGDSVTLTASAATTYSWSNGKTTQSIVVKANGNYSVTVTGANGCSAISAATTVTVNPLPAVTANATTTSVCQGSSVTLSGGGAGTYTWDNSVINAVSFVPSATTTYIVTGTDGNGCKNVASVTIVVNAINKATIIKLDSCHLKSNSSTGNQWLKLGNVIAGANSQYYAAAEINFYSVKITDANNCTSVSDDIKVNDVKECIVGISESSPNNSISIYPNPSDGTFTIQMENVRGKMGDGKIAIYNLLGEKVYSRKVNISSQLESLNIELGTDVPAGIYFLQVNTGEEIVNRKLVLEK